jgi:hypothetical protein
MKKSEAAKYLRTMMVGVQKLRSIMDETGMITDKKEMEGLFMTSEEAGQIWKWVWGENCVLPILVKIMDHYDDTGDLAPIDFFNMMYIALRLEPLVGVATGIIGQEFPVEFDIKWAMPFEEE